MTDIAAALVVLDAHLVAAGAALTSPIVDVRRGLPTGGRQIRHYYGGEVEPPKMSGPLVLNGQMVGERERIAVTWPLSDLEPAQVTAIDDEMRAVAVQIRTRIQGDSQLGGNVQDLDLQYGEPDLVLISGARHIALTYDLDMSYREYSISA